MPTDLPLPAEEEADLRILLAQATAEMRAMTAQTGRLTEQLQPLAENAPVILQMIEAWNVGRSVSLAAQWLTALLKWAAVIITAVAGIYAAFHDVFFPARTH